jgi:hypothetical protein
MLPARYAASAAGLVLKRIGIEMSLPVAWASTRTKKDT